MIQSQLRRSAVLAMLLVVALTTSAFDNGCGKKPTPATIDTFTKASRELAHDTNQGIAVVRLLFENGKMSVETKDQFARSFQIIAANGKSFNELVTRLSAQERAGQLPADWLTVVLNEWAPIKRASDDVARLIRGQPADARKQLEGATKDLKGSVKTINDELDKSP